MRHNPSIDIFNEVYINLNVWFNVQDTFLESDVSDDELTQTFTHISICCNLNASNRVPCEVMKSFLASDPVVINLKWQFKALQTKLKQKYQFIKQALMKKWKEHQDLHRQLINAKKSLRTDMEDANCKNYFFQIHNTMMEKQLWRSLNKIVIKADTENSENFKTIIKHQFKEQT